MERLRAGMIGCSAIAQMMHLPYLRELDDRFDLVALCDVDGGTPERVADHSGVAPSYIVIARPLRPWPHRSDASSIDDEGKIN